VNLTAWPNWPNSFGPDSPRLAEVLAEAPQLVLSFYSYGVLLRKQTEHGQTEYPVNPAQLAEALAARVRFSSGLLNKNTLLIQQEGVKKLIIEYRPARMSGLWIEGLDEAVRVPLPPLLLIALYSGGWRFHTYAVKRRPTTLDELLYHAPLPNVFNEGHICWGSLRLPEVANNDLKPIWTAFLGSSFGNHSVSDKSRAHPNDVRHQLLALHQRQAKRYPLGDLVAHKVTLARLLAEKGWNDEPQL
jgi:PRTRC genetic system protein B